MIVSELIDKLKEMDQDLIVLGTGYENGFNPIENIDYQELYHRPDGPWWDGRYQLPNMFDKDLPEVTKAITLT